MNKLIKKTICLFSLIICLVVTTSSFVFAERRTQNVVTSRPITTSTQVSYKSYNGYIIDNYDVDIKVNENNTFDVTEKIDTNFLYSKHGIFRSIPLSNNVKRLDGTESFNRGKVKKVDVNSQFTTSVESGNYKIKIGDPDKELTGKQNYVIKYNYNIGKDTLKNKDELYYNILGNDWDTTIKNFTFTITLPKEFDKKKLGFSTGSYGTQGTYDLDYKVEGNVIKGRVLKALNPHESVTVRLELPEGYFVNAGHEIGFLDIIYFIIPIVSLLLSGFLWNKYGKDEEIVETIEFYPPENLNSLELATIYNGEATNKDIISLLIYLANKGYLKINEKEKSLFETPFEIEKLKDYDGNNDFERKFLHGLFACGNIKDGKLIITNKDLENTFYVTVDSLKRKSITYLDKKGIYETTTTGKTAKAVGLLILSIFTLLAVPAYEYGLISGQRWGIFTYILYSLLICTPLFTCRSKSGRLVGLLLGLVFVGMIFIGTPISEAIFSETIYIVGFIIGAICSLGTGIFIKYMRKRTKYGDDLMGKIKGFKTFLETAEKDKLEAMVLENPTYFFDILPFTYVLGISDKWIKKFETINLEEPYWYNSYRPFRVSNMNHFMNSTMANMQTVMASAPSSSGSGGSYTSSGGGFSGGGSGGGGGGSW